MARLTEESKNRNEAAIRTAMERILRGDLPPGGKADLKTLAALAGVTRTGFYPKKNRDGTARPGAYQHLAEEFERRLAELHDTGEFVDPRLAQIERLKAQNAEFKQRIVARDEKIAQLTEFQTLAISRLAAQHDEIESLRREVADGSTVRLLPGATDRIAPYGSCS
jgi:DNA repair exonuclease SbcCD ATPase subunit